MHPIDTRHAFAASAARLTLRRTDADGASRYMPPIDAAARGGRRTSDPVKCSTRPAQVPTAIWP